MQHQQLVPQGEVLQNQVATGLKRSGKASKQRKNE